MTGRVRSYDEEVWLAVADPSRRSLLDLLINKGEATASGLASEVPFTRQAVAKHLAVLEKAQLVSSRRQGREVLFSVRPTQIDNAAQMMLSVGRGWDARLQSIKRIAEEVHRSALDQIGIGESGSSEETK
ncbi:MAG TPA: metalloregulator ArsR/SmtB family transcription factor [Acidimicrobiales bacterium]